MPYQRLTLQNLLDELKGTWDRSPFWTDPEGIRYINHSLRTWNLLTGRWKRKVLLLTASPASPYIALPASLTFGMQVVWGKTGLPLQISSTTELDWGRPRWEEETTTSGGDVPSIPQLWAPNGLREIALWPQDAVGSLPVLVDGVAATPVLVNLTDFVDMTDRDVHSVVRYALHVGCFKRGFASIQASAPLFRDFVQAAVEQNTRLKRSTFFRKFLGLDRQRDLRGAIGELMQAVRQQGQAGGQAAPAPPTQPQPQQQPAAPQLPPPGGGKF